MAILWLISLFVWNSLFGVFGGVILCLHESFDFHLDVEKKKATDCCAEGHEATVEQTTLETHDNCLDLILDGEEIPPVRDNEFESVALPEVVLVALLEWPEYPVRPQLHEASSIQSRAPPVAEISALTISRTTVLRL